MDTRNEYEILAGLMAKAMAQSPEAQLAEIKKDVAALSPFSACDIADALTALKCKPTIGGFIAGPSMYSPARQEGNTKAIGPVHIVEYAPVEDEEPEVKPHYIDNVPAGSILCIIAPPEATCAVYGGLMSARAHVLGAAGAVVLGRVRDLEEHRNLGFPVWANGVGTTSPKGVLKVVRTANDNPCYWIPALSGKREDGRTIINGDYIVADLNGVVHVPLDTLNGVIAWLKKRGDGEEKMMKAIKGGMSFAEASKRFRKA